MGTVTENLLTKTMVQGKVKKYNWPYSQPRLLNTVKATSRMGLFVGLFTIPVVLSNMYVKYSILTIDLLLLVSFLVLRMGIVPMVRRGTIEYVASEDRVLNKVVLIVTTTLMYSAMVRVAVAAYLITKNYGINVDYVVALVKGISTSNAIMVGAALGIAPIIAVLFPKDVSVRNYHYKLVNLNTRIEYPPEPRTTGYVYNPTPTFTGDYGQFVQPEPTSGYAQVPKSRVVQEVQQARNTKQTPKTAKKNTSPKPVQKPLKKGESVWDADRSVRRPRK